MSAIYNRGEDSTVGGVFNAAQWSDILRIWNHVDFQVRKHSHKNDDDDSDRWEAPIEIHKAIIHLRMFMDFVANGMGREIICSCVPILLMESSDPLHFVMNSLAVTFISTL